MTQNACKCFNLQCKTLLGVNPTGSLRLISRNACTALQPHILVIFVSKMRNYVQVGGLEMYSQHYPTVPVHSMELTSKNKYAKGIKTPQIHTELL